MSNVAPSGITSNTSFGRLLNEPELVTKTDQALQKLFSYTGTQPHGFFTADYKEDENGHPYITEINVRMVAFNLAFAAGGAHFGEAITSLINEDPDFDQTYHMYEFPHGLIFLRDVDAEPVLMKEGELKQEFRG